MSGRWVVIVFAVLLVLSVLATFRLMQRKRETVEGVSVDRARVTSGEENGLTASEFDRDGNPWIYYRVTLRNAPVGEKLSVDCEWMDPGGHAAYRHHYEAREVSGDPWETHCRQQFGPASPEGTWTVELSLQGRKISRAAFALRSARK